MKIYALRQCDTCRRALKEIRATGHEPDVVDVRADGVPPADLSEMIEALGDGLVNRRSTTWRGLTEAERAEPPEVLLARHPTLMKRPVIRTGEGWHLGRSPEVRTHVLG
ncbi:arsenate reductase family protein [Histidinibacterium aquaticum]|uniref:Arsenate reductase n=1 Tax=Histidinibacterium aquaticum TaxID=2613962 RepID=A0A5J5GR34_9RHOB|nr:ArsC/Spx/MgsR family protein [Histidinibacterium aquaticum]KAA9009852.1 arsenate reductase [Histidinibacterium aquaticum]